MKNMLKVKGCYLKGILFLICIFSFVICHYSFAEDSNFTFDMNMTSSGFVQKSWEAHGKSDIENTFKITQSCIDIFGKQADEIESTLSDFPKAADVSAFSVLNDVATCYFIQAESLMRQGRLQEAKDKFNQIISKYPYSQAWDPRGWFWKIADTSRESIKKIDEELSGKASTEKPVEKPKVSQLKTTIKLYDKGKDDVIDYSKYGKFENAGTKDYVYTVSDQAGLSEATGEGIYPNTSSVRFDPEYEKAKKGGRLAGGQWDFVHSPDLEAAFLKWSMSTEPQGVKLFYTAFILEKAGLYKHAIKAYYAIVVHFPGSIGWTYWHTPWYIGQAAISKIKYLCQKHPELGIDLVDANIRIINGYDNDISNDIVVTNPGRLVKVNLKDRLAKQLKIKASPAAAKQKIKKKIGEGKVQLVQHEDSSWQLLVDGKPYMIKGMTYTPTKICQSPDFGTLGNWMEEDFNKNGKIDGPYDAFVDKNANNIQDKDEPGVGDFQLMKDMGVNTIRLYNNPKPINKELLRELYKKYGIKFIIGDFFGKYAIASGATWYQGTNYSNPEHQKNMLKSLTDMVNEFKDEPYVLFWLLGNENVYGVACNADKDPDSYFKFANEAAKMIKSLDKDHPVAICSGDTLFLDKFGKDCPDVDIFGTNAYRGGYGFGTLWQAVKEETDKPAFITEYGCPAYAEGFGPGDAESFQADYHEGCWKDIAANSAFNNGAGNSIGGVVFEWLDEWWKAYEPCKHDTKGLFSGPFPDGFMHEEWLGICGQGDGKLSPFLRHIRKAYYTYQRLWRE